MKLHFHEPPPAQKTGGLDAAIRSLQAAMEKLGHTVEVNPVAGVADAAHFHGMWQPGFPSLASQYRVLGVPCVVSPHGMLEPWAWLHKRWKKLPYWHLIEKRWTRRAACILATAKIEAERLLRFFPQTRIAPALYFQRGGHTASRDWNDGWRVVVENGRGPARSSRICFAGAGSAGRFRRRGLV